MKVIPKVIIGKYFRIEKIPRRKKYDNKMTKEEKKYIINVLESNNFDFKKTVEMLRPWNKNNKNISQKYLKRYLIQNMKEINKTSGMNEEFENYVLDNYFKDVETKNMSNAQIKKIMNEAIQNYPKTEELKELKFKTNWIFQLKNKIANINN